MQCTNRECGIILDDGSRVCPQCGMDLNPLAPAGPSDGDTLDAQPSAYTSNLRRVRTLANACLILAILSFPLIWACVWLLVRTAVEPAVPVFYMVLTALAAIVTGHIALAKGRRLPGTGGVPWRARFGTFLGYFNIVVPIALIAVAYYSKGRPAMDMNICAGNLHRLQAVLQEYAETNRMMYPPLSSQSGVLMFSADAIPANDKIGPLPLTCPTIRYARPRPVGQKTSGKPASAFDDQSYFYLGYALRNDEAVEAFARAYRKRIAEGGGFDDDLVVEDGEGSHILHRLSIDVKEVLRASPDRFSASPYEGQGVSNDVPLAVCDDVPILIERDLGHIETEWDGRPRGAWVLYLHEGVRFVERGTWPITEKTQRILAELAE